MGGLRCHIMCCRNACAAPRPATGRIPSLLYLLLSPHDLLFFLLLGLSRPAGSATKHYRKHCSSTNL